MSIVLYWPVEDLKRGFNQAYGVNKAYYSQFGLNGHEGIDFWATHGSNIYACADGTVKMVHQITDGWHNYGTHVRITHANGYETIYAHFHSINVKVGDKVTAGQVIGLADSTGNSTGTHLHLTLKHNGVIIDPTPFLIREHFQIMSGCIGTAKDGVNIRPEPNTNKPRLTLMNMGQRLPVLSYQTVGNYTWYEVDANGVRGWVRGDYLTLSGCEELKPYGYVDPLPTPEPEVGPVEGGRDYDELYQMLLEIQDKMNTIFQWFK